MKKAAFHRKPYVRLKSRHPRNGLGYQRYEELWRLEEERGGRFETRSNTLFARAWRKFLRETDPEVFYQSLWIPKPICEPDYWLPRKRYMS